MGGEAWLGRDEFLGLETAWDDLVLAGPFPVPFMTHAWLRTWWRHFGDGLGLAIPVVREGERLLAAAPFAIRRAGRGLGARVAEIVGTGPVPTRGMGLADKVDLLVRPDAAGAASALGRAVRELDCDLVHLKGIDTETTARTLVPGAGSARDLPRSVSPYLPLPGRWEDYLATRSGNFRRHLRKYWRNLDKVGGVRLRRMEPDDDPAPWIEAVVDVSAASWKARRGTNLLRHPQLHAFFADLLAAMAPLGRIDLHVLEIAGSPIAYEWCFELGGRVFSYEGAFRDDRARLAPGVVVTAAVIEHAIGRGCVEYDLLRGDEGYKDQWATAFRRESELLLPLGGLHGRLTAGICALRNRLKRSPTLVELDDRLSGWLNRRRA